ncbi:MAG: B-box zinc finger protein [Kiritimatiellae bacterium]|nr:B-box zinc finger protein [Kiritimatiellia bacterium]
MSLSTSAANVLSCSRCKAAVPAAAFNTPARTICSACGTPLYAAVFPAMFRELARGHGGETLVVDTDASCFYHAAKKAVVACETCGRFLCALCDIEFNNQHLCPACIETGRRQDKLETAATHRVLYGDVALALALFPLVVWPATFFTAPAALYVAIRYWNAPQTLIPRTKARHVLAVFFALMQIGGWIAALTALFLRK